MPSYTYSGENNPKGRSNGVREWKRGATALITKMVSDEGHALSNDFFLSKSIPFVTMNPAEWEKK